MPTLSLENVSFAYGEHTVLKAATLQVASGELRCLIGPNGAGKTTALKLMAGLLSPSSGQVSALGVSPQGQGRRSLARRMAFLPQHYRQVFPFTVLEIVLMGRYAHRPRSLFDTDAAADIEAAEAAMDTVGLGTFRERRFDELSGGEQRRVLLAQALCQDAELILLDEPTASLDPAHAIAFFRALRAECAKGRTAVCVTHDLGLAARFADGVAVIANNQVVADAAPGEVFRDPKTSAAFEVEMHVSELPDGSLSVIAMEAKA